MSIQTMVVHKPKKDKTASGALDKKIDNLALSKIVIRDKYVKAKRELLNNANTISDVNDFIFGNGENPLKELTDDYYQKLELIDERIVETIESARKLAAKNKTKKYGTN